MKRINWSDEFEKFLLDTDYYSQFTNFVWEFKKCSLAHYTRYHSHYLYVIQLESYFYFFSKEMCELKTLDIYWRNHIGNLEQW